jgi:hypothetical protein
MGLEPTCSRFQSGLELPVPSTPCVEYYRGLNFCWEVVKHKPLCFYKTQAGVTMCDS